MIDCPNCNYTLRDRKQPFCSYCQLFFQECPECKEEWQLAFSFPCFVCRPWKNDYSNSQGVPLYAPSPFAYKRYETREIKLTGRNATKYRWFICTPNFPAEQYKINDPHCHAWPHDRRGEARISLNPLKLKVKWGKIKSTDQTEIEELVEKNENHIYEEWKREWIR